jgi:hypothetical protein
MVRWREEGAAAVPYPIFPQRGGLLTWATGATRVYFWLTEGSDPDRWPVVTSDRSYTRWERHLPGMAEFVLQELNAGRLPAFEPYRPTRSTRRKGNEAPRWRNARLPANQTDDLLTATAPTREWSRSHDWATVESRLGTRVPADYTAFLDACGPGRFCNLEVCGPAQCRTHDLFILQARLTAAAVRAGLTFDLSFHPAARGLLGWGIAPDGTYLTWKTVADDPNEWSVATVNPRRGRVVYFDDLSFSTFLLRYPGVIPMSFAVGDPWNGGVTFVPHECR